MRKGSSACAHSHSHESGPSSRGPSMAWGFAWHCASSPVFIPASSPVTFKEVGIQTTIFQSSRVCEAETSE